MKQSEKLELFRLFLVFQKFIVLVFPNFVCSFLEIFLDTHSIWLLLFFVLDVTLTTKDICKGYHWGDYIFDDILDQRPAIKVGTTKHCMESNVLRTTF